MTARGLLVGLTLLCSCATAPLESEFVPDGARAFEAQLQNPTGVPGVLLATQVYEGDAMIIGEGRLEVSGAFTFAFNSAVPTEMLEKPSLYCDGLELSDPQAGLLFVRNFALLGEEEEILGDVAQASSPNYLKGTSERGQLGLYAYVDVRLRLKGSCSDEVDSHYDLSLKQGWNSVMLDAEPGKLSYRSTPHAMPWFFLALE